MTCCELVDNTVKPFSELSPKDQAAQVKTRLKAYSQRVYKKSKVTEVKEKSNTVCMRENSFYVDTVKAFRDRFVLSSISFACMIPHSANEYVSSHSFPGDTITSC